MRWHKWMCGAGNFVTIWMTLACPLEVNGQPLPPQSQQAQPAQPQPAHRPVATTPEQAIELLQKASKARDLEGVLQLSAQPYRDFLLWNVLMEEAMDVLHDTMDETFGFEPRIGFRMEVKQDLLRIQNIQILNKEVVSEDRVMFTVRETLLSFHHEGVDIAEFDYLAVKEGANWKLFRPFTALLFNASKEEYSKITERGADGEETTIYKYRFKTELDELGRIWIEAMELDRRKFAELIAQARQEKEIAVRIASEVMDGKFQTHQEAMAAEKEAIRKLAP